MERIGRPKSNTSAGGAHRMLVEAHYQHDLVDTEMDWSRYRLLILPDKIRPTPSVAEKVRCFLAEGGKIIASHRSGLAVDANVFCLDELGVRCIGEAPYSPDFLAAGTELSAGIPPSQHVMYERGLEVESTHGRELARVWHPYFDRTYAHFCSHRHTPAEKESPFPGVVATENTVYFSHPIFASFMRHGLRVYKSLFLNALRLLLPEPLVTTNAPSTARISLARQADPERTIAHVLHYIPEQRYRETPMVEEIIPLFDVALSVRLDREPERVYVVPTQTSLPFCWSEGRVTVTVPEVQGHVMVVFE